LSLDDQDDSQLPIEIPGLDEATESWYQLDGNEHREDVQQVGVIDEPSNSNEGQGGLPFGYNGDSNTYVANLPFGIGSNAQGVPFEDAGEDRLPSVVGEQPLVVKEVPIRETPMTNPPIIQKQVSIPVVATPEVVPPVVRAPVVVAPEVVTPVVRAPVVATPEVVPPVVAIPATLSPVEIVAKEKVNPLFESTIEPQQIMETAVIDFEEIAITQQTEAPVETEMWTMDAKEPDMEQLYSIQDEVVEYVHEADEQLLYATNSDSIFNPELESEAQNNSQAFDYPLESIPVDNQSQLILKLHPAKALRVDLSEHPGLEGLLAEAFYAIGAEDWDAASESFQQLAASKPEDANVFNNYGISLLQKGLAMTRSQNPEIVAQSEMQFRSSILSLREAAKKQPSNSTILLNLSHALLASGRVDKALQIIRVHNSTNDSSEGKNLEAAILAAQGHSAMAKQILETLSSQLKQSPNTSLLDVVIATNLAKLAQ
jgi:Tfp pilus assembly protein PilF